MTYTSGSAPAAGSKRLKYALVASLALNLLVIGAVAGHWLAGPRHMRGDRGGPPMVLSAFAKTLPAERRAALQSVVDAERQNVRELRRQMRRVRREASEVLVAEPFDAEKLKAALSRIGESDGRMKAAGLALFIEAATKMTPAERRAFKEWREKGRPHMFRDGDRDAEDKDAAGK